jgi:hypothetical protein
MKENSNRWKLNWCQSKLSFICPREDMSSEPPQRTSTLSAQEMSGHVGQCRQDTSLNSVLETLSEGHFVDIRGICGHFMDICGHLRTYLKFAACPDKLACPQGFLSFVLSEDMSRTCPGQMKLSPTVGGDAAFSSSMVGRQTQRRWENFSRVKDSSPVLGQQ